MPQARISVGVVIERRAAASAWIDHAWRPVAVLAGAPDAAPWTLLASDADRATFYAGAAELALHRSETTNYRDNMASGRPALWVVLRPTGIDPPFDIIAVTADPSEGEAFTEISGDLVEAVPMPGIIGEAVAAFIAEHHVERTFYKRERTKADPEALGRRRVAEDGDE